MANAYMGKILWVDLTAGKVEFQDIPDEIYKNYLSGYGLGAKIIWDRQKGDGIDPLGPDNILGFCSGILTGTSAFFSGRYMVVAKSPLTLGWGDANSGGSFSPEIKKCGVDAIFFTGISEKPVYLLVDGDTVELRDASGLWGLDAVEAEAKIYEELGSDKFKVAGIGVAGEKLSLISGIVNDKGRIAARSGLGAVMGSKKLKAVVLRGKSKVAVADKKQMVELNKKFLKHINSGTFLEKPFLGGMLNQVGRFVWKLKVFPRDDSAAWKAILKRYGTMGATGLAAGNGDSPVKNWKGVGVVDFPPQKMAYKLSGESVLAYQKKKYGCHSCPVQCGGIMEVKDGKYRYEETHKPEYETLSSFGSLILQDDLNAIFKVNHECNIHGIDSISAGAAVAFAMECYEQGILSQEEVGGLDLRWGNAEAAIKLLDMIIHREGIGDVLADGVKRAAQKIGKGSDQFAIHAGGQELPMHDPRYDPGFGAHYAVEPTPGRHTISSLSFAELLETDVRFFGKKKPMTTYSERYNYNNKGPIMAKSSTFVQVLNGAGLCMFGAQMGAKAPIFQYLNTATGWSLSDDEYMEIGERIQNLRIAYNVREGVTIKDTQINRRALGEPPLEKGPNAGITVDSEALCRSYYKEMGWDYDAGKPTEKKLEQLGLIDVKDKLYSAG